MQLPPMQKLPVSNLTKALSIGDDGAINLSKRELFALQAMQGLLSNSGGVIQNNPMTGTGWCNSSAQSLAALSLECADALLAELEK